MKSKRRMKIFFAKVDRYFTSLMATPSDGPIFVKILSVLGLIALSSYTLHITADNIPVDLFSLALFLAGFFFRYKAFWWLPLMLVCYLVSVSTQDIEWFRLSVIDGILLAKWCLLLFIIVFAVDRYQEVKKYEARVKKDVDMARVLQRTLVSRSFEIGSVKVLGYIHQCMQIGGDFYFFRPFKKKYIVLAIGDVMGKGITAAFVMAIIMGVFYEWGKKSYIPSGVFEKINKRLIDMWGESSWFSTIYYGIFNEETGMFTYASAGHQRALWIKASGDLEYLDAEGLPVGIYSENHWEDRSIKLGQGDRILLFTDGISEARNLKGELYSYERVLEVVSHLRGVSMEKMRDGLLEDVKKFAGLGFEADDLALVMMEVRPGTST